jgi:hypothetical protein
MKRLKHLIFSLYQKVRGIKGPSDDGYYDEQDKVDVVNQMALIQKSLESFEE